MPSSIMYSKARAQRVFWARWCRSLLGWPTPWSRSNTDHRALLAEIDRLETARKDADDGGHIQKVREEARRLLQSIAAHRQSGAELSYEAHSVDVEGGDSG